MEIVARHDLGAEAWDRIVLSSPDGWTWALYDWQEMILGVERWRMQEQGFAVKKGSQVLAVVPLHYQPDENYLTSSGWGWTGPVLADGISSKLEKKIRGAIYDRIVDLGKTLRARVYLEGAPPITRRSLENKWAVNPCIASGLTDTSTQSLILDLTQSEDELWLGLSQDARQQIKKAEKNGYTVNLCSWKDNVDRYYQLHCETYTRTGVPPHPRAYFEGVAQSVDPEKYTALWGGVSPDGEVIAYHNDCCFGDAALYHTGCSSPEHMVSGINYLIFWHAILGSKRAGRKWYEIGEVFPGAKGNKEEGLSIFKSKFGGEVHRYFRSSLALSATSADSAVGKKIAMKNWLRSGKVLVTEVLGVKFTKRIAIIARSAIRLVRFGLQTIKFMRRVAWGMYSRLRKVLIPQIPFIRPFWGREELATLADSQNTRTDWQENEKRY
ncbi:lipid II:glycine glycyltransferase FemX [Kiloniella majae]|uniref:lipid II:glycine glycyltransferase FemX n=1 Tax=Kiloniella majae TaxID=1938558 RepID=UPI000A27967C|nr:GNAT family N-acetyltransferase [Kiloniella majae]